MKKSITKLSTVLLFSFILLSCKKEDSKSTDTSTQLNQDLIAKINSWLDTLKVGANENQILKLESLKQNLNFSELHLEKYLQNDQFVVVPVGNKFKSANNADKNPTNYLLLVLSE